MKKVSLVVLMMLLFVVTAFADLKPVVTSGEKTADAAILSDKGYFEQLVIMPDGTNDVTVSIYDNTTSSGTEILPTLTFAGDGGPQASPPISVHVANGIYVDVTTVGTVAYAVLYREK